MHIEPPKHEECEECGDHFIPPSADALWIVDAIDANGRETRDMIEAIYQGSLRALKDGAFAHLSVPR